MADIARNRMIATEYLLIIASLLSIIIGAERCNPYYTAKDGSIPYWVDGGYIITLITTIGTLYDGIRKKFKVRNASHHYIYKKMINRMPVMMLLILTILCHFCIIAYKFTPIELILRHECDHHRFFILYILGCIFIDTVIFIATRNLNYQPLNHVFIEKVASTVDYNKEFEWMTPLLHKSVDYDFAP